MLAWFLVADSGVNGRRRTRVGNDSADERRCRPRGWKWLFIIEGLPAALLGVAALWLLPDRPEAATFLTAEERRAVQARIASERRENEQRHLWAAITDKRVLLLTLSQFGFTAGSYGVGIWLPQIIKNAGLSNLEIGFLTGACYVIASVAMIAWAMWVDRTGKKIGNLTLACVVATIGLVLAIASSNVWISLSWITLALIGITSARAILLDDTDEIPDGNGCRWRSRFINSIGTLGGFVGPYAVGWLRDETGSFNAGLMVMAALLAMSAAMSWSLKFVVRSE
jgi:cyanate permease